MSPLLFLAIAIVVPLLGMIVLGIGARIQRRKATDDETGLFRRKLESIAPPVADDPSPGTPGLVRAMRRLRGAQTAKQAPSQPAAQSAPRNPAREPPAPATASIRLIERDYTVPQLSPLSTDLDELPPPAGDRRSRRAAPRPPEADRRHDRVISASQRPDQGRHPGS